MKKILRSILSWLDRKFPDKVVVTLAEYQKISDRIKAVEDDVAKFDIKRLQHIESEINKFNVHMGFGGMMPKILSAEFKR